MPIQNKTASIKLTRSRLGFYRIKMYGRNGKLMLISETYYSKSNAKRAGVNLHEQTGFPFFDMTTVTRVQHIKRDQSGFIAEALAVVMLVVLVVGFVLALCCINIKLSNDVVSGIVYNTKYGKAISGNTSFSIRAGENTPVTAENESRYCLPANSPYTDLIKRAAEDKRIKVVVTAEKYGFKLAAPWTCIDNVKVTEVK